MLPPIGNQSFETFGPIEKIAPCAVRISFPDGRPDEKVILYDSRQVDALLKRILDTVTQTNASVKICLVNETMQSEIEAAKAVFLQSRFAKGLTLFISPMEYQTIIMQPKPITVEEIDEGTMTVRTYANQVIETFASHDDFFQGIRLFPSGKKEKGKFNKETGVLIHGVRIEKGKEAQFILPEEIVCFQEKYDTDKYIIVEGDDELVCLKKVEFRDERVHESFETLLVKACQSTNYIQKGNFEQVLTHPSFKEHLLPFLDYTFGLDELQVPRIFNFSPLAVLGIFKVSSNIRSIDPLQIIDPRSKRNIFVQAAHWGDDRLLEKLIELYPRAFQDIGEEVLTEFLKQGHPLGSNIWLLDAFARICGKPSTFLSLWVKVAAHIKPDDNFEREFASLSSEQKKTLYESAFTYANPYVFEPLEIPVRPDQYSINLLWINENKISAEQEFLFGTGEDFHTRFIVPVTNWIKANPNSNINIWVDAKMASPEAIERSLKALNQELSDTKHGTIRFRDVRTIDVVRDHPTAFSAQRPIYFRVDLLRAIAADYVLSNKEAKYFVYADLDMEPLSGQQLFDKKTVALLDDFGIVLAKGGYLGYENGFLILNGENRQCMTSHRTVIIDLSIEMAEQRPQKIDKQQIYDSYPAMFTHFFNADGRYGKIVLRQSELKRMERLGDDFFRFDIFGSQAAISLPFEEEINLRDVVPTKPVKLPPSQFGI